MSEDYERQRRLTSTGAYRLQPKINTAALLGLSPGGESLQTYVRYLHSSLPGELVETARDNSGARALVLAMLFDAHDEIANDQARALAEAADHGQLNETLRLHPIVFELGEGYRLLLLDLALPALRRMSINQYQQFKDCLGVMASADRWFDLLEYTIHRIVASSLDPIFLQSSTRMPRPEAFLPRLASQAQVVLSALAWMGKGEDEPAMEAMEAAAVKMRMKPEALPLLPCGACTLGAVDEALDALMGLVPNHKQVLIQGCAACVAEDGEATLREAELLRAIASSLAFPVPSLLPRDAGAGGNW